jgi:hypothetical protein
MTGHAMAHTTEVELLAAIRASGFVEHSYEEQTFYADLAIVLERWRELTFLMQAIVARREESSVPFR